MRPSLTVLLLALVGGAAGLSIAASPLRNRVPVMISRAPQPLMSETGEPDVADRAFACMPYILPALDGFSFGAYVYKNVPGGMEFAYTFLPFVNLFHSLPFAGLIFFIGLSTFTRNTGLSRFVRFNIQQALLLDIALIIPGFLSPLGKIFPADVNIVATNCVFYAAVLTIAYACYQNVQGKTPDQVPVLSEASAMQIGPF